MIHVCPVCGFPDLAEPPRRRNGSGSFEICPSCGFQFGVSDADFGYTYDRWRKKWIAAGMNWTSRSAPKVPGWKPEAQLAAAGLAAAHRPHPPKRKKAAG